MVHTMQRGFTLIELMIVIAILGIIMIVAVPAYEGQTRKTRRQEALTTMQDLAMRQERWRADNPLYATLGELGAPATDTYYTYSVPVRTASTYTLQAVARGGQANDTGCATLTYAWNGATRTVTKGAAPRCWSR